LPGNPLRPRCCRDVHKEVRVFGPCGHQVGQRWVGVFVAFARVRDVLKSPLFHVKQNNNAALLV
jgi:hypothetical protein